MSEVAQEPFVQRFLSTFSPPRPSRGKSGKDWWVSRVWSDYTRSWLDQHFRWIAEFPAGDGRRLDAAVWYRSSPGPIDVALEWEWDNNESHRNFATGDFRKLLEVQARCGVALLQTRAHTRGGIEKSDDAIAQIVDSNRKRNRDHRPVFVIDIRRVLHSARAVEFVMQVHDIASGGVISGPRFAYSE